MIPLRAGLDVDGVLANFRAAFEREANRHLADLPDPDRVDAGRLSNQDMKRVWTRIQQTHNWWLSVEPFEPGEIARLYQLSRQRRWEVVFMTKRPLTAGDPIQFQTQRWLEEHGFHHPAVVTVPGSRGELVNALRLDIVVDDQLYNCVDVVTGSHAKTLLLDRDRNDETDREAIARGIGVVRSLADALEAMLALDQARVERKGRLQRLSDWFIGRRAAAPEDAGV